MPRRSPIKVDILARPETSASTLFGLYDVLNSVGVGWEANVTGEPSESQFDARIVAASRDPFRCAGNVLVSPMACVEDIGESDIAIVASLVTPAWSLPTNHDERELDWIRRQRANGAVVASACTGALVLAESHVADGCIMTTHWAYRDLFRLHYPKVTLRLDKNLCISGPDNEIVTCGGSTAWHELALHLIVRFCSVEYASRTARFWLMPKQEDAQTPFSALSRGVPHNDAVVSDCQVWISGNYAKPNPVSEMAEKSGLPRATFARRFKRATGYHPMDYVHTLRVEEAKELLEISARTIDEIGREVGYEDTASFRRLFKRKTKLTPTDYRRKFGKSRFERYELAQ